MGIRYFLYLVLMSMLVNTMIYVPNILFQQRFNGALPSMLLSIPLSTILVYAFSRALMKFPKMGLSAIFKLTLPKWARIPILLYLGTMWYIAGFIVLVSFAVISKRYINPDMSLMFVLFFFCLIAAWGAIQASKSVLYIIEIIILLNTPVIFFIVIKALTSPFMRWAEVFAMTPYLLTWPKWDSLSAATYLFIGYINMITFNQVFEGKFTTKYHWVIPILGFSNLITTFAVPIGFHGLVGIENYAYPWITTADSLHLQYAFIERVVFVFLLLYISISLLFGVVTWHVALKLFADAFERINNNKWNKISRYCILTIFILIPLASLQFYSQPSFFHFAREWLSVRLISEIAFVGIVCILAIRRNPA